MCNEIPRKRNTFRICDIHLFTAIRSSAARGYYDYFDSTDTCNENNILMTIII